MPIWVCRKADHRPLKMKDAPKLGRPFTALTPQRVARTDEQYRLQRFSQLVGPVSTKPGPWLSATFCFQDWWQCRLRWLSTLRRDAGTRSFQSPLITKVTGR